MNLLDHNVTGLHEVTEAIHSEAESIGLKVTAGELVGLVPLSAMVSAGNFYMNDKEEVKERMAVEKAIQKLMLDKLGDFDPESSIIEWAINRGDEN